MKCSKYIIYGLIDPRNNHIRYIGKSSSGLNRAYYHKTPKALRIEKTYKTNWINKLKSLGLSYKIVVLTQFESNDLLNDCEIFWIQYFKRAGFKLVNATNGGDGSLGIKHSEITKQKLSLARKGIPRPLIRYVNWPSREDMVDMLNKYTHKEIAEMIGGKTTKSVEYIRKVYNIPRKEYHWHTGKFKKDWITKEWLQEQVYTKSIKEIAIELGVSFCLVQTRIKRLDVKLPTVSERNSFRKKVAYSDDKMPMSYDYQKR